MSESYVREKLWQAVDILAGDEPLRARLHYAGEILLRLKPEDFDDNPSARATFTAIRDTFSTVPRTESVGGLEATTSRMSDSQAKALAWQIIDLYGHYLKRGEQSVGAS
jgi:hypothetical protein